MPIKMIATDLDGTLLRRDKSISPYTKEVLQQCRAAGVKVIYATGRGGSANDKAPAALFDGRITMNGAVAYAGETLVHHRQVPHEVARPLLLACHQRGLKTASERGDMHYANFDIVAEWPSLAGSTVSLVDFAQHSLDAEKLYMVTRSPEDAAFIEQHLPEGLWLIVDRYGLAQVMHRDAAKSKAVGALAAHWGIQQHEIAAFGDDHNDVDMLRFAGTGVAMANAVDEAKAAADCLCATNDEDGLARWLEKLLQSI